jgi:hypothetical protein
MVSRARPRGRLIPVLLALTAGVLSAATLLESARYKFAQIEYDRVAPGMRVTLTSGELTAYAREQAEILAPGAVRKATLTITPGHAEASAMINFLKLRRDAGVEPGFLMQKLLDGERPVRIVVKIQSAGGRARVDVERVEISGVAMEGRPLDFLLRQFVIPSFPNARVGDWFELEHNIDRFDLKAGGVDVWMRRR